MGNKIKEINEGLKSGELAVITDMQRYSVHDGPGIRTIVFFKGCPLRCKWCQNPETFNMRPEIIYMGHDCIGCEKCIEACPEHAIIRNDGLLTTDRTRCVNCGRCALICPSRARQLIGKVYSVDEVMEKVKRDKLFFENSGGGVTLSGGEVTMQSIFAQKLLLKMKDIGVHTAIETCGHAARESFRSVAFKSDLILFDLKHLNAEKHKLYTGVDNNLIRQNLQDVVDAGIKVIARYPLIPGVNDSVQDVEAMGVFCNRVKIEEVHILPFHQAGKEKWIGLDIDYDFSGSPGLDFETVASAAAKLNSFGLKTSVGGSGG